MKKYIKVKTQFEGIHQWKDCPYEEVKFLRDPHRHIFYVEVVTEVTHSDRAIEFFMMKKDIDAVIKKVIKPPDLGSKSCEMMCEDLYKGLREFPGPDLGPNVGEVAYHIKSIEISEDNENSGIVELES